MKYLISLLIATTCSVSFGYGKLVIEPQKLMGEEFKSEPVHINFGFELKESLGKAFIHSTVNTMVMPVGVATEHQWKTYDLKNAIGWQMMEKSSIELGHQMTKDLVTKQSQSMIFAHFETAIW